MRDAMSDPRFRTATAADLPAIVALLAEDDLGRSREDPGPPLPEAYLAAFQAISEDSNQVLAVAERGGAVVGCLQISFIPGLSRRASGVARSRASAWPPASAAPVSAGR
jgi:hypothetical protein